MPNSNSAVVRPSARRREHFRWIKGAFNVAGALDRSGQTSPAASRNLAVIEPLEDRQLMSVVYVSASGGRDTNTGRATTAPLKTLAKAKSILKSGDQMLLKAGDSWYEALGDWNNKGGTTIGSYGTGARPKILTAQNGIYLGSASNITIKGISFNGLARTAASGIVMNGKNSNITIDNCEVDAFRVNITAQGYYGKIYNLKILNSTITDANGGGMSHGMYADKVAGLTISNTVFDRNGGTGSIFNHGVYITGTCSGLVATNSTFAHSSNFGMQARAGGTITGNKFDSNSVGLSVGIVNGSGVHTDGGVTTNVSNNTFSGKYSLQAGIGISAGNIKYGTISGNKFLNGTNKSYAMPIQIERGTASGYQVGVVYLKISDNYESGWGGGSKGVYVSPNSGVKTLIQSNNRW